MPDLIYSLQIKFKVLVKVCHIGSAKVVGRQAIVVEPNTVSEEYSIVWRRTRVDTDELIYLRTVRV